MRAGLLLLPLLAATARAQIFTDSFQTQDGLITNAYALWHSTDPAAQLSPDWLVYSGSLFVREGVATTGVPDDTPPNAGSTNGTGSATFRLLTARGDFGDADIYLNLMDEALTESASTPKQPWDGAHVVARYQDEKSFYYASVDRRDDTALIKKKVGGAFWDLSEPARAAVPYSQWQQVRFRVKNNPDGSVSLSLWRDNRLLAQAVDTGAGGPPIHGPGRVGLRGDNARLKFGHFRVEPIAPDFPGAGAPAASKGPAVIPLGMRAVDVSTGSATITWVTEKPTYDRVDYGQTASLGIEGLWSQGAQTGHSVTLTGLIPNVQYYYSAMARTEDGAVSVSPAAVFTTPQVADTTPPTVVIVSPQSGQSLSGTIGLTCNAQDNVAVAGVQWELDGNSLGPESSAPPFGYAWNSQETYNGSHTIRAIARDSSNNRTASQPITISVTGAKPRY